MPEYFEDRHRALREAWLQYPAGSRLTREELYQADRAEEQLQDFDQSIGALVDDQVAAHRRLAALLQDSVSNPIVRFSGVDLVQWAIRLSGALSDSQIALAALDEGSGRG